MRGLIKQLTFVAMVAATIIVNSCAGTSSGPDPGTTPTPSLAPTAPRPIPTTDPLPEDTQVVVANSEVVVGPNRLYIAIYDGNRRPISNAQTHLQFFKVDQASGRDVLRTEAYAQFIGAGIPTAQGSYSTRTSFAEPGQYTLKAAVTRGNHPPVTARSSFNVQARSSAPNIGDRAIASKNLTSKDVPIKQLTSERPTGDPDFYQLTIAQALRDAKPLLLVFSSPGLCLSRTCGPQMNVARSVKRKYPDRASFIHIEALQRPDLILTGEQPPAVNPILLEWHLHTEPWVYIIGADGRVHDRFEGFASKDELEQSLLEAITSTN